MRSKNCRERICTLFVLQTSSLHFLYHNYYKCDFPFQICSIYLSLTRSCPQQRTMYRLQSGRVTKENVILQPCKLQLVTPLFCIYKGHICYVGFEVLRAASMKMAVFWCVQCVFFPSRERTSYTPMQRTGKITVLYCKHSSSLICS
jgi:hypothetical protein